MLPALRQFLHLRDIHEVKLYSSNEVMKFNIPAVDFFLLLGLITVVNYINEKLRRSILALRKPPEGYEDL